MADIDMPLAWRMQQDGYLMQINQLRAENDKLIEACEGWIATSNRLDAENAKLRELADGAANEADRLTHDAAALQIENAKLRMLCADMWEAIKTHKRINFAQLLRFGERVSELEIEVPS